MERLAKRKTIRLPNYDYRSRGVYHVTICSKNNAWIFGHIEDGRMILNELGALVDQKIGEVSEHYPEVDMIASVVMPNHVHLLVGLGTDAIHGKTDAIHGVPTGENHSLANIVGGYKASVTRAYGKPVWQPRFYEHIIRNEYDLVETMQYIQNNPTKWDLDKLNQMNNNAPHP